MATLVSFWSILEDKMANFNLGLIEFKLGLYIKVNVSSYLKKIGKMAINWHKIGQMPLLGKNINWA